MTKARAYAWPRDLVDVALSEFPLPQSPHHGISHWSRVRHHGVALSLLHDLNPQVASLFGLFHDCRRENEYEDPDHGDRASDLVQHLATRGRLPMLSTMETDALIQACAQHSDGLIQAPLLVQVCWDADRLDLGRVGIRPDPRFLCTPAARDSTRRAHAYGWSRGRAWHADPDPGELFYSEQRLSTVRSRSM